MHDGQTARKPRQNNMSPPLSGGDIILYKSMKFYKSILKGFQVIKGTQTYHCRISKGNNSKNV